MATQYRPGNPFSRYFSLAEAAISWQRLSDEQQSLVVVNDEGLPYLAGVPDLAQRAEAILEAVHAGEITGSVLYNAEGRYLLPGDMQLLRDSAAAWIAEANRRLALPVPPSAAPAPPPAQERLLTKAEVCKMIGLSSSTLDRRIKEGLFPKSSKIAGTIRWPLSVVSAYIADQIAVAANAKPTSKSKTAPVKEVI